MYSRPGWQKTEPVVWYEGLRVDSEDVGVPDPDPGHRHVIHVGNWALQVSCTSCQKIFNFSHKFLFFIWSFTELCWDTVVDDEIKALNFEFRHLSVE